MPPDPEPLWLGSGAVLLTGLSSLAGWHASNPMETNKRTDPRMAGRTYGSGPSCARRSRLGERFAGQVANAVLLDHDIILDPDPAERAQLGDRRPVDQVAPVVGLERG